MTRVHPSLISSEQESLGIKNASIRGMSKVPSTRAVKSQQMPSTLRAK